MRIADLARVARAAPHVNLAETVHAAQCAQPSWAARPLSERCRIMQRFADGLQREQEALARLLSEEMGKPITQARGEITVTCVRIAYFIEHVRKVLQDETMRDTGGVCERISYEPLGVIANISAWNYPYFVGTNVFVPALLAGNGVLYKPSEFSAGSGLAMALLLHEAGVPADVFVPVVGDGRMGAALLEHPLAGVFFTGSYATGLQIAQGAAKHLMKLQLELGGKDPLYVCDDVAIAQAAVAAAEGAFYNTGQSCCAVERIYVHRAIHDTFVEHFVAAVRAFVVGDSGDPRTFIGPLTRPAQIALLEAQVADACRRGGKLACGGARLERPGHYFAPTVVLNAQAGMLLMRQESFGPVIGIQQVDDDAEAIRCMNDTEYGLTAAVYSRNEARACAVLQAVDAGTVYWNCCDRVSAHLPWTGRRHSGIGSTLSHVGIRAFVQPKAWHLKQP